MNRREEIAAAAWRILARDGEAAVTMRALADELGIQAPSLYKHVRSREEVLADVAAQGLVEFGEELARARDRARRSRTSRVASMAAAYRRWARENRALYELMMRRPLDRDRLAAGLEATAEAPLLDTVGGDRAVARALWAMAHGLVDLELSGRFPPDADLEAVWRLLPGLLPEPS